MTSGEEVGHFQPNFPGEEIRKALGLLTVSFSMLEGQLAFLIWELLHTDEQRAGQIVTAGMPFSSLLDAFCSLFKFRAETLEEQAQQLLDELDELRKAILEVEKRRNLFMHSQWAFDPAEPAAVRWKYTARAKQGYRFSLENVNAEEVRELAGEMSRLYERLSGLYADLAKHRR